MGQDMWRYEPGSVEVFACCENVQLQGPALAIFAFLASGEKTGFLRLDLAM
jgi:hypothetical protein